MTDATTTTPIARCVIAVNGHRTTTDAAGRFDLDLPAGLWSFDVSADGFLRDTVAVTVPATGRASVSIVLVPERVFSADVSVVAPAQAVTPAPATTPVLPATVVSVAGGGENVFRVLQTLPGVSGTDDFSSRLSVRGGGPDQNLTVMDGVEVHNPYRLFGLTSAFNPETVEQFELTAGAFSARYGDRLSSLLVVNNRAGSKDHTLTGSGALSMTDANIVFEGKLPKDTGSWLVTGRRTYYDLVAERFTDSDLPSFNDLQGKVVRNFGGGRTLSLFGMRSREATDAAFTSEANAADAAIFTRAHNDLAAATFYTPVRGRGWSRTILSYYKTTDILDFGGTFRDEERRSNAPDLSAFDTTTLGVSWNSTVRDQALRQELGMAIGANHVFETGFEAHQLRTTLGFTIDGRRNDAAANGSSLQGGSSLPDSLQSARTDTRAGAWFQDRWQAHERLAFEAGVRVDRSTINDRTYVSPRLAGTWTLGGNTRLRGAVGVHRQSPGYEKLSQADYFLDLSGSGPLPLESERARHVLLSLEHDVARGLLARVETYYKGFDRSIIGRLESTAEKAARLAQYDFPTDLWGSVPTESMVTTFPTNDGRGRAWGVDVYAARRPSSPETRLTGWASYTFGVAERTNYGITYPFDYDRRHAVSLVMDYRVTRKQRLSAVGRVSSGFPYTPALGLRVAATPDIADFDGDGHTDDLIPQRDASGLLVYQPDRAGIGNMAAARLPFYARLDARWTYVPDWGGGRVWFYLDVINAFNRKNAGTIRTSLEYDPSSDRPRLVNKPDGSLPFFPSLGIHIDFGRTASPRTGEAPASRKAAQAPGTRRIGYAVGFRAVGSDGLGLDAIVGLSPHVGVRASVGVPTHATLGEDASATPYEVRMPIGMSGVKLDWHPRAGRFRTTGGLVFPRSPMAIAAKPAATYDVGGVVYTAAELGSLTGTASIHPAAPYVGVGWGRPAFGRRRFGMSLDAGVAYDGAPNVSLSASGPLRDDAAFKASLARETTDVAAALRQWQVFPVISLTLTYRLR